MSTNREVLEFRIEETNPRSAVRVLAVYGDADLHSAPELRERLHAAIDDGTTVLVLDLSETTLIDSTSLGVLLGGLRRLRAQDGQDGQVRLVVPQPELRRVFEITMLDRIFELHESREDALAESFSEAG